MTNPDTATAILTVDLGALADNWQMLNRMFAGADLGGVVKADAYGVGVKQAAPALWQAGCRTFFVATIDEGAELRRLLPESAIHVMGGLLGATEPTFIEHGLVPVLNSLGEIEAWGRFCRKQNSRFDADIHIDTGMCRLGLPADEVAALKAEPERIADFQVVTWLSHMASADETESPQNTRQLSQLSDALAGLPLAPVSFANSSTVFLGPEYHFDAGRPGAALYGVNPTPGRPNPMGQAIRLQGKILQIRGVDPHESVGYGATHRVAAKGRIATVGVGYADGYLRSLSNRGRAFIDGHEVPVVGRVSMDLITLDVTNVPEDIIHPGTLVDLIGPDYDVDAIAHDAGTIGYEILTSLGKRYHRRYVNETWAKETPTV